MIFGRRGAKVAASAGVVSHELRAKVTVGPITAAKLGVPVGTEIDLGRIAYTHRNPIKRWWGQRKVSKGFNP